MNSKECEPFDYIQSEKLEARARILNCDDITERWTRERKEKELADYENSQNEWKVEKERRQM